MTMRDTIEGWLFAAIIIIGLPALIFATQRISM
jgi:hypothetical protein